MYVLLMMALTALFDMTIGYGKGALNTACISMMPCHAVPLPEDPPTVLSINSTCYIPSIPLQVTIDAPNRFKGIFLQMRSENTSLIAKGTFGNYDLQKFKLISCKPGRDNALTNRLILNSSQISFNWTPSPMITDKVDLVYTFVETYYRVWAKVKKSIPKCQETAQRDVLRLNDYIIL